MAEHPSLGPFDTGPTDRVAAHDLRDAILTTRSRLVDVLHARARTLASITTWVGPHRTRYDEDAAALLAAGRALDDALRGLLVALDAELDRPVLP